MISRASQKVKGGKVVTVEIEHDDGAITRIKITGDFFLHPEDLLEKIETSMIGIETGTGSEAIASTIRTIAEAHDAQMIGVDPESMALVIKEALG